MATAREYLDGIVEYVAKIRAIAPTDEELDDARDDLQSAELGLYQLMCRLEEEHDLDPDTFDPEKGTYSSEED